MEVLREKMRVLGQKNGNLGQKQETMGSENKIFWLENEIFGMENEDNNPHGKKGLVELKIFVKVMGQKMIFYGQKMEVLG